jgi:hypothetical protein
MIPKATIVKQFIIRLKWGDPDQEKDTFKFDTKKEAEQELASLIKKGLVR